MTDTPNGKRKVLVVDDEPENISFIKKEIERLGYETFAAGDGLEGIAAVKTHNPEAVFTDTRMPNLNGVGMAKRLREEFSYRGHICLMSTAIRYSPSGAPDLSGIRDELRTYGITDATVGKYFGAFLPKSGLFDGIPRILGDFFPPTQLQ